MTGNENSKNSTRRILALLVEFLNLPVGRQIF
jgi:hypothetical protein